MRRQGGGFGFVMLLVVMAVVLFLVAKRWKTIAPVALEIHHKNKNGRGERPAAPPPEEFEPATAATAEGNTAPPVRPSLGEMDKRTTAHTDAVQSALDEAK